MRDAVVQGAPEAEHRLRELGLERDYIDRAVRAGANERKPRHSFEPKSAPGLKDWIARVGELRSCVVHEAGWRYADPRNVPLVYTADKTTSLGVLLGDRNTGDEDSNSGPRSKYPKGAVIASATANAAEQPQLDLDVTQSSGYGHLDDADLARMDVWFLVTYPVEMGDRFIVKREVSLANPITPDSHINSWRERLLLPPMDFGAVVLPDEPEGPDDIDVYVGAL